MSVPSHRSSERWSIPAMGFAVVAVVVFLVVLSPPGYHSVAVEQPPAAEAQGGGELEDGTIPGLSEARIQVVPTIPTIVAPQQQARTALLLKLGPGDRYVTVGQVASGARVEVVGRNEKGDWLAISLNLGSKTYGWVRANSVAGVANTETLPVVPIDLLR